MQLSESVRVPFTPSPRPEPPVSALFLQIRRNELAYDAAMRRADANFRMWIRDAYRPPVDGRLHRWLFALPGPVVGDAYPERGGEP